MRRNSIFLLVLILFAILLGCGNNDKETRTNANPLIEDSLVIELDGADSVTVLQLLQQDHQVEFRKSSMGVFVTGIDATVNGGGYYWVYTVNDTAGTVACNRYRTTEDDDVRWHFRKWSE